MTLGNFCFKYLIFQNKKKKLGFNSLCPNGLGFDSYSPSDKCLGGLLVF